MKLSFYSVKLFVIQSFVQCSLVHDSQRHFDQTFSMKFHVMYKFCRLQVSQGARFVIATDILSNLRPSLIF